MFGDEEMENSREPSSQNFRNYFAGEVYKADRSEI